LDGSFFGGSETGASSDGGLYVGNDGVVRGPVTPQGTRVPINNGRGQGNIGDAINSVLDSLFGPRR
jgi:hypothetical protein